jgi:hypothetical protein
LGGFDSELRNPVLESLNSVAKKRNIQGQVHLHMTVLPKIKKQYSNLSFTYTLPEYMWDAVNQHTQTRDHEFRNFVCSFNGGPHVGRKMLTAILNRFKWFNPATCSKNFLYTLDELDGHLSDYVGDRSRFYRKFFLLDGDEEFFQTKYSFHPYTIGHLRHEHNNNVGWLEDKITQSFLHLVSETVSTSYHPFITEKFLYSVINRGLFITYGQPGWHKYLETCYGFKKYHQLFDYTFDSIQNPVERLVELMSMLSKFSMLSPAEWRDLHEMEKDTLEYNYHHYVSRDYLKCLEKNS